MRAAKVILRAVRASIAAAAMVSALDIALLTAGLEPPVLSRYPNQEFGMLVEPWVYALADLFMRAFAFRLFSTRCEGCRNTSERVKAQPETVPTARAEITATSVSTIGERAFELSRITVRQFVLVEGKVPGQVPTVHPSQRGQSERHSS